MKILMVNKFLFPKGGDAISTLATGALLRRKGHQVLYWGMAHPDNPRYPTNSYFTDYVDYEKLGGLKKQIIAATRLLYSFEAKNKVEKLIQAERPNLVHLNNFAHQISPSILDVFSKYEIPTVMTMRDYKLICPCYTMLSNGKPCEMCKNGKYYHCFFKKCTKGSYSKSMLNTVEMYLHHKILHIYDKIDIFISPSKFLMEKVKRMGFDKKIVYLPNFVDTKDYVPNHNFNDATICYFGRIAQEKGLFTLVDAMVKINARLKIIGDGPMKGSLESKVEHERIDNVDFVGFKSGDELKNEIRSSMTVILPSEWYENNPRTILEAFALGKPLIGARIGGIPELVTNSVTGYTFEPGNAKDLREKIKIIIANSLKAVEMGKNARRFVEENFNPEKHYQGLSEIYQMAIGKYVCK